MQQQRFELKYLIPERVALLARDFVASYLEIDEYGALRPNLSYPVHSLYLDSDDLSTYHQTVNGTKNRFKLRLRYYDDRPDTPVFFEIKRRVNDCILKQRGGVRRDAVPSLLAGHLPEPSHLLSDEPKHMVALQRFSLLMNQINARPKAHVAYVREAWISEENNAVRVTMDRQMTCEPRFVPEVSTGSENPVMPFGQQVILELKFTDRFPDWFGEMIRVFSLMQFAAAKYAEGVTLLGEHCFHDGYASHHAWTQTSHDALPAQFQPSGEQVVPKL